MSNNTNTFLGVIAGIASGAILGILFAPDKGSNTRRRIAEEATAVKDKIADEASTIRDNVVDTISQKKGTLDEQLEEVVSNVSYKTEDVISSLEAKLARLKEKNRKLQKNA
ncbi:YtxH domain-containing protein [Sungkyunkwania multivorans]|uniref:YtxH domain-containing protein n=1 Tax=Sungkyunkwania multivorans TaxID=1173618 RepID=A0ABW3CXG5_9FLAO